MLYKSYIIWLKNLIVTQISVTLIFKFQDLQTLADSATNGLILFSLGTNVQGHMLGDERITMILQAFRKLSKYTFLWKINLEEFPLPLPSNVKIRKWLPQTELLGIIG